MASFTEEEDQFLRDNYLTIPATRLSSMMGRSKSSARQRMAVLGLSVPKEIAEAFKAANQIKPGNTPINKGKKQSEYMRPESIAKTACTRFGKGNMPHNTKHDGYERLTSDGYIEIRVRQGVFKLKHRLEWEKVNGKIPKGNVIVCKTKDITNCDPSNWEMISMKENMRRNSATVNLPDGIIATYIATKSRKVNKDLQKELLKYPDLLELKRQDILLNRTIKQIRK